MKTAVSRAVPLAADAAAVRQDARALGRTVLGIAIGLTAFGLVMIYSWTAVKFADRRPSLFVTAIAVVLLGLAGIRFGKLLPIALVAIPLIVAVAASRFHHVGERLAFFTTGMVEGSQQSNGVRALGSGGWIGAGLG